MIINNNFGNNDYIVGWKNSLVTFFVDYISLGNKLMREIVSELNLRLIFCLLLLYSTVFLSSFQSQSCLIIAFQFVL